MLLKFILFIGLLIDCWIKRYLYKDALKGLLVFCKQMPSCIDEFVPFRKLHIREMGMKRASTVSCTCAWLSQSRYFVISRHITASAPQGNVFYLLTAAIRSRTRRFETWDIFSRTAAHYHVRRARYLIKCKACGCRRCCCWGCCCPVLNISFGSTQTMNRTVLRSYSSNFHFNTSIALALMIDSLVPRCNP